MAHSTRFSRSVSPDINEPVAMIKRERSTKLAAVLGGIGLLTAGLVAVPYLDFRHSFDPGPAETTPSYAVDRSADGQGTPMMPDDAASSERTEPPMQMPTDSIDMNDQGARGSADESDTPVVTPDNQPSGDSASPSSLAPSSE